MKTEEIKNSPFKVVETDNEKTYVVLGNVALLECENKQDATEKVEQRNYDLLINLFSFIANHENKTKSSRSTKKQKSTKSN